MMQPQKIQTGIEEIAGDELAHAIFDRVLSEFQEDLEERIGQVVAGFLDSGEDVDDRCVEAEQLFHMTTLVLKWVCDRAAQLQLTHNDVNTEAALVALVALTPSWKGLLDWRDAQMLPGTLTGARQCWDPDQLRRLHRCVLRTAGILWVMTA
jgi:hypothetical protein